MVKKSRCAEVEKESMKKEQTLKLKQGGRSGDRQRRPRGDVASQSLFQNTCHFCVQSQLLKNQQPSLLGSSRMVNLGMIRSDNRMHSLQHSLSKIQFQSSGMSPNLLTNLYDFLSGGDKRA